MRIPRQTGHRFQAKLDWLVTFDRAATVFVGADADLTPAAGIHLPTGTPRKPLPTTRSSDACDGSPKISSQGQIELSANTRLSESKKPRRILDQDPVP